MNGGPDMVMGVLHEDSMIVHGIFPGRVEVFRNPEYGDGERQRERPYPGGDRVVPSDLLTISFKCIHHLLLSVRAGLSCERSPGPAVSPAEGSSCRRVSGPGS